MFSSILVIPTTTYSYMQLYYVLETRCLALPKGFALRKLAKLKLHFKMKRAEQHISKLCYCCYVEREYIVLEYDGTFNLFSNAWNNFKLATNRKLCHFLEMSENFSSILRQVENGTTHLVFGLTSSSSF